MQPDLLHIEEQGRALYELLPNNQHSPALASSIVIAGAHILYGYTVSNTNTNPQYVQVFDLAVLPADGAVPAVVFTVPGASDKAVQWLPPRKMLQGIVLCNSSTAGTKTIGAADCFFDVQYL